MFLASHMFDDSQSPGIQVKSCFPGGGESATLPWRSTSHRMTETRRRNSRMSMQTARQIITVALLFEVGRGQVDGYTAHGRELEAAVADGGPHPLPTFLDGGVRQTHHVVFLAHPQGQIDFDIDDLGLNGPESPAQRRYVPSEASLPPGWHPEKLSPDRRRTNERPPVQVSISLLSY